MALLLDQVDDQEYQDALALRRIHEDKECFDALKRLVAKLNDDLIRQWTDDTTGERTKKWLKGAREMCGGFLPAIEEKAQLAQDVIAEKRDLETASRSKATDGHGSGDLAIS